MTNHFKNMLELFAANATGKTPNISGELDIEEIRRLSLSQGIWTMVFPELSKVADASKYYMLFFKTVSSGIAQKEFNLKIIKKLEDAGIKCCILKGAAVSHLYKDPECRISGDTDILIDPKDEKKLVKVLKENGYLVEERESYDHHTKAMHPVGGLLEAHIALYSETTAKILFGGKDMYFEDWTEVEINHNIYHTLGINDNLMYLTAHYIKHLVNEGGGVRQMMDLLLYIEEYKDKIDFEKYNRILKELRYDKLVDVVKTVGAKYFGFDYEIKNEELAEKVLTDSEIGGIFGFETDNRKKFYDEYCKKREALPKYKTLFSKKSEKGILIKLFPSSTRLVMYHGYGYAKNKILVPVAWIHRYFDILSGRRKKTIDKTNTDEFQSRMQMMRELGMIE